MGGERNDICNTCTTFLVTVMNELRLKKVTLRVLRKHLINNDYLVSAFAFINVFTRYRFEHRSDVSHCTLMFSFGFFSFSLILSWDSLASFSIFSGISRKHPRISSETGSTQRSFNKVSYFSKSSLVQLFDGIQMVISHGISSLPLIKGLLRQ